MKRPSLYERTRGPNALPVTQLVSRADEAVAAVKDDYRTFLRNTLPKLDALYAEASQNLQDPACWVPLKMVAYDLRSSSATAGYDQVSDAAGSLEWLLAAATASDDRVTAIVGLHLDALHRLVDENAPPMAASAVQELLSELARASNHVTRTRRF